MAYVCHECSRIFKESYKNNDCPTFNCIGVVGEIPWQYAEAIEELKNKGYNVHGWMFTLIDECSNYDGTLIKFKGIRTPAKFPDGCEVYEDFKSGVTTLTKKSHYVSQKKLNENLLENAGALLIWALELPEYKER